ncbi:MAG: CocE/NonD family hydrolase [Planctomycetes bacterium]|nr:CocE/NonD family hydrolase [Planctomycetota bacterium]
MRGSLRCGATFVVALVFAACASARVEDEFDLRAHFTKREELVPMRDGVKLFTVIYEPKDTSTPAPILMNRTPYGVGPYGAEEFKTTLGPSKLFHDKHYVFVHQDVRGRCMSEGTFVNMTPHRANKTDPTVVDESSDAYDTIEWLLKNVQNHNGRVGMWGISYPGFYAAAGMIDAHPALKAVSPQAPIADWWFDDFHHHGAFFIAHAFNFLVSFGQPRPEPTTERGPKFEHRTKDGYQFFLDLGPLARAEELHMRGNVAFWRDLAEHPNYDAFWAERNLLPHLHRVAPAVMTVGGLFDAEDLYGPLQIYRTVERENPTVDNVLVMGPWRHGGWARGDGDQLGHARFGAPTSVYYRETLELPFFESHLRGDGSIELPEATVFDTGTNAWRTFTTWPPESTAQRAYFMSENAMLGVQPPTAPDAADAFVSDPAKPVPLSEEVSIGMSPEYMTADQRFAARRPDVLTWSTPILDEDVTILGPLLADLVVSTTGQDADWIVKLVDVFPGEIEPERTAIVDDARWSNYHMLVRSETFRGRFRDSYAKPKPFVPGEVTRVAVPLQDVCHTFKRGHRIQVQVQSTWLPLIDRNPQSWVDNIWNAREQDFIAATHRVHRSKSHASSLSFQILQSGE